MIPVPVVVTVLGGWCAVYLADTLLKVRAEGAGPDGAGRRQRQPRSPRAGSLGRPRGSAAVAGLAEGPRPARARCAPWGCEAIPASGAPLAPQSGPPARAAPVVLPPALGSERLPGQCAGFGPC